MLLDVAISSGIGAKLNQIFAGAFSWIERFRTMDELLSQLTPAELQQTLLQIQGTSQDLYNPIMQKLPYTFLNFQSGQFATYGGDNSEPIFGIHQINATCYLAFSFPTSGQCLDKAMTSVLPKPAPQPTY